ncbi:MAG: tRNA pseudouridine synthase [Hydrocarboniphaga sp.]|uniref:tRNA pseudouridine(38-40) synthase TruA n=1 Tax=Hydrocarboniphaga sp. TaxID=2033016 RepID=UPI002630F7CE|nr:tRNA pseudouridine(38-40) synthase TruA [Hydrocarboniphaga sp.]MDB5968094.1 tRNA pseudouridine synthase [Hydrocarboniphaga sp.]
MTRWAAAVEYVGTRYSGWQSQPHAISVQGELEAALSRVAAHPVAISAAGRTDAGVHGYAQVIHFDSLSVRSPYAWLLGTNANLPADISLRWVQAVRDDFHARHSAVARRYRYVMHNSRARSALLSDRAAWLAWTLDADAMHRAAQHLAGELDFSAFRGSQCQSNTPMRCITDIAVHRENDFVLLDIRANAFLHHMVRNIAGTLIEVGSGRRSEAWVAEVLAGRDRTRAGMTAPAQGLYFVAADYPSEFGIPAAQEFWLP